MSQTRRSDINSVVKAHCNKCGGSRNHDILYIKKTEYEYDDDFDDRIWECFDSYELLRCCGCEAIQLKYTYKHAGDNQPRAQHYPPRISRRAPAWLNGFDLLNLPINLFPLLSEVYTAVENNLRCLAAMGIRAVLELVMRNNVGEQATFTALVDKFQNAGHLSTRQAHSLNSILEAGHAATHRAWEPTDKDITTLLDITEAVIATTYLHEKAAQALEAGLPSRPKRR
jgi:hypothetical protein